MEKYCDFWKKIVVSKIKQPIFPHNHQTSSYTFHISVWVWKCLAGKTPIQFMNTSSMWHLSLCHLKKYKVFANIHFSCTQIHENYQVKIRTLIVLLPVATLSQKYISFILETKQKCHWCLQTIILVFISQYDWQYMIIEL